MDRPRTPQDRAPVPLCPLPTSSPTRPPPPWRWKALAATDTFRKLLAAWWSAHWNWVAAFQPDSTGKHPRPSKPPTHPRPGTAAFEIRRRRMSPPTTRRRGRDSSSMAAESSRISRGRRHAGRRTTRSATGRIGSARQTMAHAPPSTAPSGRSCSPNTASTSSCATTPQCS